MSDSITLPIPCASCGGAIILHMAGWQTVPPNERERLLRTQTYACPHCQSAHTVTLPGLIARVDRRGHG